MRDRILLVIGLLIMIGSSARADRYERFLQENPETRLFMQDGRVTRIYGEPFSHGTDPINSAETFIMEHAEVFGIEPDQLRRFQTLDGMSYQPVMFDREMGQYKFYAVYYDQIIDGVPIYSTGLTLLVRNEPNYPLVLAVSRLWDVDQTQLPAMPYYGQPRSINLPVEYQLMDVPSYVIYHPPAVGLEGETRLAVQFSAQIGQPGDPIGVGLHGEQRTGSFDRRLFIADAQTGRILFDQSLIYTTDVAGHVNAWATPGLWPDRDDNPPELFVLTDLTVGIVDGPNAETDTYGDYIIPYEGTDEITVRSIMIGPALSDGVFNAQGEDLLIDQNVFPPGPADFEHNPNPTEFDTSQVNVMRHTALVHTWLAEVNPSYPGWDRPFYTMVNVEGTCNAFYAGDSMFFYRAGDGCGNAAFSTIIYHEYGHKIVDDGADEPTLDYHEGLADCTAALMTDNPIGGDHFYDDGGYIRTCDNNRLYPCSGGSHHCGQVMSGSVWHTRDELVLTEPDDYLTIITDLTINSILLHAGGIDPGITIDFLTLDDDDANILNGTPHYSEIDTGFSRHNMGAPPLELFNFNYPDGLPIVLDPAGGTTVRVEISDNNAVPIPETGMLYYNENDQWHSLPMEVVSDNIYDAVFPAIDCGNMVDYYFAAEATDGKIGTDPPGAPAKGVYSIYSAIYVSDLFSDNFETDTGWTVENIDLTSGAWERGVPSGNGWNGDPTEDYDGSGSCYITGNNGENVDGGPTRLISPAMDMTNMEGYLTFAVWMTSKAFFGTEDSMEVEVSNDDGQTWTLVEDIEVTNRWVEKAFRVSDHIPTTDQVRVRFSITDNPSDSITEGGFDAFLAQVIVCEEIVLDVDPLIAGQTANLTITGATPNEIVFFAYSVKGEGNLYIPQLDVTIGLQDPQLAGTDRADSSGLAQLTGQVPLIAQGHHIWLQALQYQRVTNVVHQVIQ